MNTNWTTWDTGWEESLEFNLEELPDVVFFETKNVLSFLFGSLEGTIEFFSVAGFANKDSLLFRTSNYVNDLEFTIDEFLHLE